VNTAPGGDAMTVRYHRGDESAALKPENARRPVAWEIHPDDVVKFAAGREHCETRRCRNPAAVVTWRYWRSAEAGRVLLAGHLACEEHGQGFAKRHHITVEPAPAGEGSP
jgi:hypothetical protein